MKTKWVKVDETISNSILSYICKTFVANESHGQQYCLHIDAFYRFEFSLVETTIN